MEFTAEQLANWALYEEVRRVGKYNMLDSRARELTGLSQDEYFFVLDNYSELKAAYEAAKQGEQA